MAITFNAQYVIDHISHALAGLPAAEIVQLDVVNQAGEHLVQMHPWRWLMDATLGLSTVAGQNFIDVDAAITAESGAGPFMSMISITTDSAIDGDFEWATMDEIQRLRTSLDTWLGYKGCLSFDTGSTGDPGISLELWPTPTASEAALTMRYRQGWTRAAQTDTVLTIPIWCHSLLIQLARAFALGYEEQDTAGVDARLASIHAGHIFRSARDRDAMAQPDLGVLQGGIGRSPRHAGGYRDFSVGDPT